MEDKELQELFEAKRTTEANRRRQEQLAAMIAAKNRRALPLWPVWAGAVAASVALLVVALPMATNPGGSNPVQVACIETADVPTPAPQNATDADKVPIPASAAPKKATSPISTPIPIPQETATPQTEERPTEPAVAEPAVDPKEEETIAPTPRVMRRTSTMLACTDGCPEPAEYKEPAKKHTHIEFFSSQQFAEATAYTITFNK
ncbi:MAG: hypothetical protein IKC19_06695 [Bacteroidales bacterium]|nr:hypothetical protein [Bacteroidales bacterium]